MRADDDEVLRNLVKANTEAVCIVAKASELHVTEALRTTLDEALAMAADSVAYLRDHDLRCSSTPSISSTGKGECKFR